MPVNVLNVSKDPSNRSAIKSILESLILIDQMPDIFTPEKRSEVMSRIKNCGNKSTELKLIKLLKENSLHGWRRNFPLLGKPDFVFPKQRFCVFTDGCFWHGCPKCYKKPKQNASFWLEKLQANKKRDRFVTRKLRKNGWKVLRIWECKINHSNKIVRLLKSGLEG
jgi:DNA mismatch endonuclease, patch repair protein